MSEQPYFPESDNERDRLESKTDCQAVIDQACWAGLRPGMRVLDVGCGPGITSSALAQYVGPAGSVVGVDRSAERVDYAREKYGCDNLVFTCRNFFDDLDDLGSFDFVWMRFILEYFQQEAFELVRHVVKSLKTGGICCLADLDHNCLNHHGLSERLEQTFRQLAEIQMTRNNFDPFAGRKLFTFLHDLGFQSLSVDIRMHHLLYGDISEFDKWNWWQKIDIMGRCPGLSFDQYEDGFAGFKQEVTAYLSDPRRFVYTPLVLARGQKPD